MGLCRPVVHGPVASWRSITQPDITAVAVGRLARRLLVLARDGGRRHVAWRLAEDGRLHVEAPPLEEEQLQRALSEDLGSAHARWDLEGAAAVVEFRAEADLQSPDVLYALRDAAAAVPEVRFELRLPSGVRDVQRARSRLDSRPP